MYSLFFKINNMDFFSKEPFSLIELLKNKESCDVLIKFDIIRQSEIEIINLIAGKLQEIYPDNWDIQIQMENLKRSKIMVIIHFPVIEIRNETQHHTIHDIYVAFEIFKHHSFKVGKLSGVRTRVSYPEFLAGYRHSHLESTSYSSIYYSQFCLGSGEINQTIMICNNEFNIDFITLYLLQIEQYLSWESIEGGPHIRMVQVFKKGNAAIVPTCEMSKINDYLLNLLSSLSYQNLSNINMKIDDNGIIIISDDEQFEDYCLDLLQSFLTDEFLYLKDGGGNYCGSNLEYKKVENLTTDTIRFRNKDVQFKLDYEIQNNNGKKYVHPALKKVLKNKLEYELNKQKIKSVAFR